MKSWTKSKNICMNNSKAMISVHGRVQGVWFRAFVRNQALRFQLTGWVKNMADGSVYCEAQGSPENMRLFLKEVRRGSDLSKVERVDVRYAQTDETFTGFTIRH